jgi:hypothetical protein
MEIKGIRRDYIAAKEFLPQHPQSRTEGGRDNIAGNEWDKPDGQVPYSKEGKHQKQRTVRIVLPTRRITLRIALQFNRTPRDSRAPGDLAEG